MFSKNSITKTKNKKTPVAALLAIYRILIQYDKTNIHIVFVHHSNLKKKIFLWNILRNLS